VTHWKVDQPVARPLSVHRTTQTQDEHIRTSISRVGFKPTISVSKLVITVNTSDRSATVEWQVRIILDKIKLALYVHISANPYAKFYLNLLSSVIIEMCGWTDMTSLCSKVRLVQNTHVTCLFPVQSNHCSLHLSATALSSSIRNGRAPYSHPHNVNQTAVVMTLESNCWMILVLVTFGWYCVIRVSETTSSLVLLSQINSFTQIIGPASVTRRVQQTHRYIWLTSSQLLSQARNMQQCTILDTTRRSSKNDKQRRPRNIPQA
jgi:hypothetical protein